MAYVKLNHAFHTVHNITFRYEFGNKGADIFIEALARLNFLLKNAKSDKTVVRIIYFLWKKIILRNIFTFVISLQVAFLIFPTKTNSFNVESLRGHAVTKGLKDTIDEIQKDIGKLGDVFFWERR